MNGALKNINQSLTFRQWSRKGYAIFASLGKEVNIGHVDVEICEKASEKNNIKKTAGLHNIDTSITEDEEVEELSLNDLDAQLISCIGLTSQIDESSQLCCILISKNILNNLYNTSCSSGCSCVFNNLSHEKSSKNKF